MTTDERLERLERELTMAKRHNRWLIAIAGTIILTLFLARIFSGNENTIQAQAQGSEGKVIVANKFILQDETSRTRAVLSTDKGNALLVMSDRNGKLRVLLDTSNDRPGLALFDEEKNVRAVISLNKDVSSLDLHGKSGTGGITLSVIEHGVGLTLLDERKKPRVGLGFAKDSGPLLQMFDEKGKPFWSAP
jgi:hypothetical protein